MIFKCTSCGKWKWKKIYGICVSCDDLRKDAEHYFVMEDRLKKKSERREVREVELNEKLRKELSEVKVKKIKVKRVVIEEVIVKKKVVKKVSLEREASMMSANFDSVLYVYADVKRIKVIEWVNGKKRVALNKEREIRHTHKGGFSQEKFQKFVDTKKKNWLVWVEDNLSREGVLRGPYEKIVTEGVSQEFIIRLLKS